MATGDLMTDYLEKMNAVDVVSSRRELERAQQLADLERRFTYHPPKASQPERYTQLRAFAKAMAVAIAELTPPSREQSLAFTALEESVMWANASIARNE